MDPRVRDLYKRILVVGRDYPAPMCDPEAAALGTEVVADLAGLRYVARSIEDLEDLTTRYVAVGNDYPARTGSDRVDALVEQLEVLGEQVIIHNIHNAEHIMLQRPCRCAC